MWPRSPNPNDTHAFGRLYAGENGERVLVDSYDDDCHPITGHRSYKHFQDDPRCEATAKLADGDWSYWQLHHCLLADLSGYNQHDDAIADYLIGAGRQC